MTTSYYIETVSPVELPLSLSEVKEYVRIKDTVTIEDNLLLGLLTSAVIFGENYCRRQFVERTWQGFFSAFDSSIYEPYVYVEIDKSPVVAVDEVSTLQQGSYVAVTDYQMKKSKSFPRILFPEIPYFDCGAQYIIRITFSSGYGAAEDVPEIFKTALKEHVAFLYENRGDVQAIGKERIPEQVKALYNSQKIINTF